MQTNDNVGLGWAEGILSHAAFLPGVNFPTLIASGPDGFNRAHIEDRNFGFTNINLANTKEQYTRWMICRPTPEKYAKVRKCLCCFLLCWLLSSVLICRPWLMLRKSLPKMTMMTGLLAGFQLWVSFTKLVCLLWSAPWRSCCCPWWVSSLCDQASKCVKYSINVSINALIYVDWCHFFDANTLLV